MWYTSCANDATRCRVSATSVRDATIPRFTHHVLALRRQIRRHADTAPAHCLCRTARRLGEGRVGHRAKAPDQGAGRGTTVPRILNLRLLRSYRLPVRTARAADFLECGSVRWPRARPAPRYCRILRAGDLSRLGRSPVTLYSSFGN